VIAPAAHVPRWPAALALGVLLAANLPGFLRTPLDCDPILFDLFVRDAGRGRVLYRDMLENNTPAMIWLHAGVRAALGWSSEALRAADVLVVGAGLWLLAGWFHRGRPDRTLLAAGVLAAVYLSTTEWCHCQRDAWVLLPVLAAMRLRRDRRRPVLEGAQWAVAVWLKPHVVLVAAAVWLASWRLDRRAVRDLPGLVLGGLVVTAGGIGAMVATGVWEPYLRHLTTWAGEYPGADLYGPYGRGLMLLGRAVMNLPWSGLYLLALPAAAVAAFDRDRPDRSLLAAALVAWAAQAFLLQHVFDYVHLPAALLAVALLLDVAAGRLIPTAALLAVALIGHAPVAAVRLAAWPDCFSYPTPALRDRLATFQRIPWAHLHAVADFLDREGCHDGEVNVVSDTALPLYTLTGLTAPTRYYIPRNNLLAYKSRRPEITAALAAGPAQRLAVYDLAAVWKPPTGCEWATRDDWPADVCLGRWADRVAFRAGRLVVLRLSAAEVPGFLFTVSEF
jgi:hypothetical protein